MSSKCPDGEELDAGLCYKKCPSGYTGVGPVCWGDCPSDTKDIGATCAKKSYGRGAGTIPKDCKSDQDKDGDLCYPKCRHDYRGVGPVCWGVCPSGFRDAGISCAKPKPYGRGAGYVTHHLCNEHHEHCEKYGLLWYPRCARHYHNVGCCICSPNCPDGFHDQGEFCLKPSYGRGAGTVPEDCGHGETNDAGLCYNKCHDDYDGVGPVCWSKCAGETINAGAFCTKKTVGRGVGTIPPGDYKWIWVILGIILAIIILVVIIYAVIGSKK